jgi:hypothetical protein
MWIGLLVDPSRPLMGSSRVSDQPALSEFLVVAGLGMATPSLPRV